MKTSLQQTKYEVSPMSESESAITTPTMSRRRRRRSSGKKKADPTIALIRERNLDVIIANELSISRQAVSQWKKVPWNRVLKVSSITGRPPHLIRPDIYPAPPTAG